MDIKQEILSDFEEHLRGSEYKVYRDSIKVYSGYVMIYYQAKSLVDFSIFDEEHIIYGIGILVYRMLDDRIFEVNCHLDLEIQIDATLRDK